MFCRIFYRCWPLAADWARRRVPAEVGKGRTGGFRDLIQRVLPQDSGLRKPMCVPRLTRFNCNSCVVLTLESSLSPLWYVWNAYRVNVARLEPAPPLSRHQARMPWLSSFFLLCSSAASAFFCLQTSSTLRRYGPDASLWTGSTCWTRPCL